MQDTAVNARGERVIVERMGDGVIVPRVMLLSDSRTSKSFSCSGIAGTLSETVLPCSMATELVVDGPLSAYTVSANKRMRLIGLNVVWRNPNILAAGGVTVRLRAQATGTAGVASPLILSAVAATSLTALGGGSSTFVSVPDGFELPAGSSFCLTQVAITTGAGVEAQLLGYEY